MTIPTSFYAQTISDNTVVKGKPESTNWEIPIPGITATNIDAIDGLLVTLSVATAGIILGVQSKDTTIADRHVISVAPASSVLAQRENKWLVRYHNPVSLQKFQVSIGTADLTLLPAHGEYLDIATASTPGRTFRDAFQAVAVCPDDSAQYAVVDSIQFVGRNT
jgi:hypothetical protein